jgi:predicted metalloprotease
VSAVRVAALLCAALLIAGCGSSSDDEEPQTTPQEDVVLDQLPEVPAATESTPQAPTTLRGVFDDVQAMWKREFEEAGATYTPATLTIFHDEVDTACGTESANTGPFYCPADHGVYLDTRFFAALGRAAGVQLGHFAQAYVIAHEVGHHVQTLTGVLQQVHGQAETDPVGANARSVRLELQADCLAGIWKHSAYRRDQITPTDFEDALRAAAVVGSDFQQKLAGGVVTPEDWTHGSSAQRQHWLTLGFQSGKPADCDTFAGD